MSTALQQISSAIKNWWVLLILGILFVLGGIWVFRTPAESYVALSMLFALTFLVSGIGSIIFSIANRELLEGWGWQLAGGILELLLGIALFSHPGVTMAILPFFVGFWLMFRGILTIAFSIELKKYGMENWVWVLVLGIVLTVLSMIVLFNPLYGASLVVTFTGLSLLVMGLTNILIALRLRKVKRTIGDLKEHARGKFESMKKELESALGKDPKDLPELLSGLKKRVDEALKDYR